MSLLSLPNSRKSIELCVQLCRPWVYIHSIWFSKTSNHKIIERFGLEGTYKGHLVHLPCSEQGHLSPEQVAQSPVQPDPEHFQGGGSHSFSRQPVPGPHHPHGKEFLISNLNLCSFSLKPLPLLLSLQALVESPNPALLQAPSLGPCHLSLAFRKKKITILIPVTPKKIPKLTNPT